MSHTLMTPNELELLRQDFRLILNEVYELRRLIETLEENKCEYLSIPRFAKLIGLSSERVRQLIETGMIKAVQPAKDKGRWRVLSTEIRRLREEAKANHFNNQKTRKKIAA